MSELTWKTSSFLLDSARGPMPLTADAGSLGPHSYPGVSTIIRALRLLQVLGVVAMVILFDLFGLLVLLHR